MKKELYTIKDLNKIEKILKTLPKGYISKKNIYGKDRYYGYSWERNS